MANQQNQQNQQKTARWVTFWALLLTLVFAGVVLSAVSEGQTTVQPTGGHCDLTLNRHVYHPQRLEELSPCLTVTGTLMTVRKEKDGDEHWQLKLDDRDKQDQLLNDRNRTAQRGYLVIEPTCVHPVIQTDAIAACKGFRQSFPVMKIGAHVQVTGRYVEDQEANHGWREIHPPTAVVLK